MAEHGEPLSNREIEVLELLTTGATNRQIAHELVVSVNTVKVHLRNIYTKLGVESRTEATLIAIREGLVAVPGAEAEALVAELEPVHVEPELAASTAPSDATPYETLPPLPWPKRVALVLSVLLVTVVSIITWPRSQTAAGQSSDDTDNRVDGVVSVGMAGESTGWRALAPMTLARSRFALATTPSGALYAIAGETNGGITGSVERYDPTTDQWIPLPTSKPTRVSNVSAATVDDWIYVPGGWTTEGQPTTVVEAYNPAEDAWKQVASLPHALSGYALTVYDGQLYVFGGKDDRSNVNTTYIYDPQQDGWREGKTMPTSRAYVSAATLDSRIYVVGGYDGEREQSTCEVYHPQENTWESCEPLTLGRGGLGLAAVADRLYAIGGGWSNTLWFSEEYNPSTTAWTPFETPVSRQWRSLAVASTFDRFYVAGGWNGDYLNGAWEYVVLSHKIFIP